MSGRILIADDDDVLSEMLVDYLATEGFEVTRASDGGQALDKVVSDSPELVVLDIMMPKLNGIEALKAIRKDSPAGSDELLGNIGVGSLRQGSGKGLHLGTGGGQGLADGGAALG